MKRDVVDPAKFHGRGSIIPTLEGVCAAKREAGPGGRFDLFSSAAPHTCAMRHRIPTPSFAINDGIDVRHSF